MKGKNGRKWAQISAFVVRETKVGAFAAFKHINYCRFSCQVGFCDSFRLWTGPGQGCSWFHLSCEKGCTTGWRGQTKAPSGVVSLKNRTQCSSFTIFIAFSGMNFRSAPSFGSPVPLGVVVCGWGFWASEKWLGFFAARQRLFEAHAYPSKIVSAVFTHVSSPFSMSAEHLESKIGVREIFWSHFQLLKQFFLSICGSGVVV